MPRSVDLAIRAAWGLVGMMVLVVVLMAVFPDQVVGAWADHHEGAREVFDQGGRLGLERAGFAPPSFVPVGATMVVVGAMLVWVLGAFLRLGYRWGQLGLSGLMACCVYASIALGFVLGPPPVFVVVAVVTLLVEGVALVCLWHHDTLVHVRGPWIGGPGAAETPAGALGQSMEESGPPEPGPASPPSR
ncbi:MAG TPA: hypothetical protein VFI40_01305 [Nocardioides sp.]|nr:hypothetical protein [Nocardioides sp.]